MTWKSVVSAFVIGVLTTILLVGMFTYLTPVRSVVPGAGEPRSLKGIVEYTEPVALNDLDESEKPSVLDQIMGGVEGFSNMSDFLQGKGYHFDNASAKISWSGVGTAGSVFAGWLLSWWSDMGPNGKRALIIAAFIPSGANMIMGAITNLLPPEQVLGVDPYIIVNAMPYMYITWYWWVWAPVVRLHSWHYWWYDSHSHPNWFWGVYWWWRTDVDFYWIAPGFGAWLPWWWFFWHWTYWRHWYWWSTWFNY